MQLVERGDGEVRSVVVGILAAAEGLFFAVEDADDGEDLAGGFDLLADGVVDAEELVGALEAVLPN